jgi:hypothetical protein
MRDTTKDLGKEDQTVSKPVKARIIQEKFLNSPIL